MQGQQCRKLNAAPPRRFPGPQGGGRCARHAGRRRCETHRDVRSPPPPVVPPPPAVALPWLAPSLTRRRRCARLVGVRLEDKDTQVDSSRYVYNSTAPTNMPPTHRLRGCMDPSHPCGVRDTRRCGLRPRRRSRGSVPSTSPRCAACRRAARLLPVRASCGPTSWDQPHDYRRGPTT